MQRFWQTLLDNLVLMMVLLPLVGACLVAVVSRFGIESIRRTVLTNVLLTFSLSVLMVANYDPQKKTDSGKPQLTQMTSKLRWLGEVKRPLVGQAFQPVATRSRRQLTGVNVQLAVGVDGVSLWFISLTALLMLPAVLAGWDHDHKHPAVFYALLLLLEAEMIGLFAALDVALFCIFLEGTLLPMFLLIGLWGGYERRRVVGKFFLYNLAGSLLVFVGLLSLVLIHAWMRTTPENPHPSLSFSTQQLIEGEGQVAGIRTLAEPGSSAEKYWSQTAPWTFLALLVGFALLVPVFPFHTWLPAANVEAPAAVSLLLSGVGLKAGCYGFLRFVLPLFSEQCIQAAGWISAIAVVGLVYAGLLTLSEHDLKKLTTYASLSQIGLCVAGIFSLNRVGVSGGLLQLVNHGICVAAILFLIGVLERRYGTRDVRAFGGLSGRYPRLGFLFTFSALALVGVPGLNSFAGELLTLMGIFRNRSTGGVNAVAAMWGLMGSLLVAWAFVRLIQRAFQGRFREPVVARGRGEDVTRGNVRHGSCRRVCVSPPRRVSVRQPGDLTGREVAAMIPLAVLMIWIGLYPQLFLSRIEPSVSRIVSPYELQANAAQTSR